MPCVLEPDIEEGGFVVHVPALPEIVTEGDSEAEALAMAEDAIGLVLELHSGGCVHSEYLNKKRCLNRGRTPV